jgi:hypothetical protein
MLSTCCKLQVLPAGQPVNHRIMSLRQSHRLTMQNQTCAALSACSACGQASRCMPWRRDTSQRAAMDAHGATSIRPRLRPNNGGAPRQRSPRCIESDNGKRIVAPLWLHRDVIAPSSWCDSRSALVVAIPSGLSAHAVCDGDQAGLPAVAEHAHVRAELSRGSACRQAPCPRHGPDLLRRVVTCAPTGVPDDARMRAAIARGWDGGRGGGAPTVASFASFTAEVLINVIEPKWYLIEQSPTITVCSCPNPSPSTVDSPT